MHALSNLAVLKELIVAYGYSEETLVDLLTSLTDLVERAARGPAPNNPPLTHRDLLAVFDDSYRKPSAFYIVAADLLLNINLQNRITLSPLYD